VIGRVLYLLARGVGDMRLHPLAQALTLATVALVTLLAGLFLLALHNIHLELLRHRGQVQFQIYWEQGTDLEQVKQEWARLSGMERLKEITTFTPEQALDDLSTSLAGAESLGSLKGQSPLPPTAYLSFAVAPDEQGKGWAKQLFSRLRAIDGVAKVTFNPMQLSFAQGWLKVVRGVVWPVIGFLGLVAAMVVGNTVRLSLMTRRDEVEILHLVGARQWYIRLPLLTAGAVQGLLGGALGLGLLKVVQLGARDALSGPPLNLRVAFLPLEQAAAIVCIVTAVGVLSSWVAVRS
jgi:cell division transport system permease protein